MGWVRCERVISGGVSSGFPTLPMTGEVGILMCESLGE